MAREQIRFQVPPESFGGEFTPCENFTIRQDLGEKLALASEPQFKVGGCSPAITAVNIYSAQSWWVAGR